MRSRTYGTRPRIPDAPISTDIVRHSARVVTEVVESR